MILAVVFIIVGFVLLIEGADFLIKGASNIAKKFHIPEIVIGLTIVSIGTSMPELFVSITSALDGYSDMAIGNVVGSNIANLFLILGSTAMVRAISFKKETIKYEIPICFLATVILLFLANTGKIITKIEAIIMLSLFIAFIAYTIVLANKKKVKEKNSKSDTFILIDILFIVVGILGLKFGGDFTVNNAIKIAKILNLSEKVISITILAVGTSLPELVTSIVAAKKGENDLAIGNIIGSNIFNILLIIGTSSFIKPIIYNTSYNRDMIILLLGVFLLFIFAFTKPKGKMSRLNGLLYFLCYAFYMVLLFLT